MMPASSPCTRSIKNKENRAIAKTVLCYPFSLSLRKPLMAYYKTGLLKLCRVGLSRVTERFRSKSSTIDSVIIKAVGQQEKCRKQRQLLYMAFIDLKAFDVVRGKVVTKDLPLPPQLARIISPFNKYIHRPVRRISNQKRCETGIALASTLRHLLFPKRLS